MDDELVDFLKLLSTFEITFSGKIQMLSPIMGESTKIVGESKNAEILCALPHYGGEQRGFSKISNSDALPHNGGELGESTLPHF